MSDSAPLRILVVGAGAIGGYFGGRLLAAGRDVTFLVRPRRAEQLARDGLVIASPHGDLHLAAPPTVTAATLAAPFDLVLLSCKAFDLDAAIADVAPAVGARTAILPLLNGLLHLDALDARFGATRVLGGLCAISTTLDTAGRIAHLGEMQSLTFGERDGAVSPRVAAIAAAFGGAGFESRASEVILLEMWEKFVFLATLAGITSLLRAPVGAIVAAGGAGLVRALLAAGQAVARAAGYPPRPASLARAEAMLTAPGSPMTASMLRDIQQGRPIEAEHILGDLLRRHEALVGPAPDILRAAYVHAACYEAAR
jgi:2-dehydropantoate 2-reductase